MKEYLFFLLLACEFLLLAYILLSIRYPRFRTWPPQPNNPKQIYFLLIFFYLFLIGVVYLSIFEAKEDLFGIGSLKVIGLMMFGLGIGLYAWSRFYIRKWKVAFGLKDKLIVSGPYRFTRNPIYIADTLIFIGFALLCDSPLVFVVLVLFSLTILMLPLLEEPWLRMQYGAEYEDYCSQVPRYIPQVNINLR